MGGWSDGPSGQNIRMVDRMMEGPIKPLTEQAWKNAITTGAVVPPAGPVTRVWWEVAVVVGGVILGASILAGAFFLAQLLPT
jgi:hypothetical protein